jgi:mycothiol synthase
VVALAEAATLADAVAPLSEQALLDARNALPSTRSATTLVPSTSSANRSEHLLAYAGPHLAGYAQLDRGSMDTAEAAEATGEVVVDPSYRRQGVGTALVHALENALEVALENAGDGIGLTDGTLRLWAHGDLDGARALARQGGYSKVRELWQMRRPLRAEVAPLPAVSLPEGFRTRRFVVGEDEEAWLRVNARAFANHPEQGRITRDDLDQRIAEPWFDARGFILVDDVRGPAPVLAASHWTKVVPASIQGTDPAIRATEGEVYVVGVDPAYQGLGLGRAVTVLGLEHLRDMGLSEATLYVDADNEAAVATYSRLGFARSAVDVMYSRRVHDAV